jgi:hypothetical protein
MVAYVIFIKERTHNQGDRIALSVLSTSAPSAITTKQQKFLCQRTERAANEEHPQMLSVILCLL